MASIVVFLVALPLCIGVAAASGVPVALGIITGIVGGLVVGFLPGSSLQVSGPAAGLAVLVLEFVTEHGVALMGPVVLLSGLIQMVLGVLKMGRVFQSISLSVVQGMLAGIGLPLILSQTYALVDSKQLGSALKNIAGLPHLVQDVAASSAKSGALLLGVMAVVTCFMWYKVPAPLSKVPAPLVAVLVGSALAAMPWFDVKKVTVANLTDAIDIVGPSQIAGVFDPAVLVMVVTFCVIASAESLFSAAAVDRMHTGPRTEYNKELFAQGVGNAVSGLLGAMPLTAVIVRSAANVNAGAKTKISRILHGVWLLGFGLLLPGLLGLIPITVLAGVLLHAGWKLFNPPAFVKMWKTDRGEGVVMFGTTLAIVVTNLLDGVLVGLAIAVILTALRMSQVTVRKTTEGDTGRLELSGNATFIRLPQLIDALGSMSDKSRVVIDATRIRHLDMACAAQLQEWADQANKSGDAEVELLMPGGAAVPAEKVPAEDPPTVEQESVPAAVGAEAHSATATAAMDQAVPDQHQHQPHQHHHQPHPQHHHQQPETFRPYVPQAQPNFQFPHMGQGYAHGHTGHGNGYARTHTPHHQYGHQPHHHHHGGHNGQVHGRTSSAHQQAHMAAQFQQQSHVHVPNHQGHGPGQGPGPYPQQHTQHMQQPHYTGEFPVQYPGQYPDPGMPQGYPVPQGYGQQPGDGTYWGPEDDWAFQQFNGGTQR
jgi:MFS superfamily sulfate permease-like transporter